MHSMSVMACEISIYLLDFKNFDNSTSKNRKFNDFYTRCWFAFGNLELNLF